ncbi:MAG: hypothetical protein Q8O67_27260 [Deltaproteobacteria bacterium]|nr:hypothetical protein [Deltaproteobacteria bacterium]
MVVLGGLAASLAIARKGEAIEKDIAARATDELDDDTPPEKFGQASNEALSAMRVSLQKGLDEVKKAREEKDAIRLTCVNEPVAAMKGVMRVAEDGNVDLQEALGASQVADARRAYRKVRKSKRRMDDLLTEAQNCTGADSSVSTTSVKLTIDEDVIAIDPYYGDNGFFVNPGDALARGDTGRLGEPDGPTLRPPNASGIN